MCQSGDRYWLTGRLCMCGGKEYMGNLYLPLNFSMNLNCSKKNQYLKIYLDIIYIENYIQKLNKSTWNYHVDQETKLSLPLHKPSMLWLLLFSSSVVSDSLRPHGLQHARLPCPSLFPRVCSNSCPLSRWCHTPSCPLSSTSPHVFNLSQHQGLFKRVRSSHQVAKVLELQLQYQFFQWIFKVDFL